MLRGFVVADLTTSTGFIISKGTGCPCQRLLPQQATGRRCPPDPYIDAC